MPGLVEQLFSSSSFIPHGHCYLWNTPLVWLHILSDSIIALAYYSIPITLVYFVQKRKDLPFNWVFLLFSAFIILCGTTHLMEVWTLWHPTYWLSGTLKALTALVSLYTAIYLVQLMPQALTLPSPAQLTAVNLELTQQIRERQKAEEKVRELNQNLEQKVAQRTAELEYSMGQIQDYAERMTLAMDAAKMGSWDWDLETQKITWSSNHEILWGYSPGNPEHSHEDWKRPIHPADIEIAEAAIQYAMATHTDYSDEYRVLGTNGTVRWIAGFGRFYFNEQGKPFRMLGMVQDITERKNSEAALLESEERFRNLADNISQLAWMAAEDGGIVWYNRRWFDYTGTTFAQMQGWGWQQVHHPAHVKRVVERFHHSIETGEQWEDTFPLRGKDGKFRWFSVARYSNH